MKVFIIHFHLPSQTLVTLNIHPIVVVNTNDRFKLFDANCISMRFGSSARLWVCLRTDQPRCDVVGACTCECQRDVSYTYSIKRSRLRLVFHARAWLPTITRSFFCSVSLSQSCTRWINKKCSSRSSLQTIHDFWQRAFSQSRDFICNVSPHVTLFVFARSQFFPFPFIRVQCLCYYLKIITMYFQSINSEDLFWNFKSIFFSDYFVCFWFLLCVFENSSFFFSELNWKSGFLSEIMK